MNQYSVEEIGGKWWWADGHTATGSRRYVGPFESELAATKSALDTAHRRLRAEETALEKARERGVRLVRMIEQLVREI